MLCPMEPKCIQHGAVTCVRFSSPGIAVKSAHCDRPPVHWVGTWCVLSDTGSLSLSAGRRVAPLLPVRLIQASRSGETAWPPVEVLGGMSSGLTEKRRRDHLRVFGLPCLVPFCPVWKVYLWRTSSTLTPLAPWRHCVRGPFMRPAHPGLGSRGRGSPSACYAAPCWQGQGWGAIWKLCRDAERCVCGYMDCVRAHQATHVCIACAIEGRSPLILFLKFLLKRCDKCGCLPAQLLGASLR